MTERKRHAYASSVYSNKKIMFSSYMKRLPQNNVIKAKKLMQYVTNLGF